MVVVNLTTWGTLMGVIAFCVRHDQRGKMRRRELEHEERMRAIAAGVGLDDAAVARYRALGAVGVAVPVTSLSVAVAGSCFALAFDEPQFQFGLLAVVWVVCGAVALAALPATVARLRESPRGGE